MRQNKYLILTKALIYFFRHKSSFSKLQLKYIFNLTFKRKHKYEELKIKVLQEYIGLKTNKDNNYTLDDLVFCQIDSNIREALIGMCLDIILKDEFYTLKNTALRMNIKDSLLFYFYQEGPYEIEEVQIQKNEIVIDAGANMGIFSVMAAKKGAVVYAFEPQDVFLTYFNRNVQLNKMESRIQINKYAIGNQNKQLQFSVNKNNLLAGSIYIDRFGDHIVVDCITIDKWVKENDIKKIDFIKADIEGAERLLIEGAKKTLIQFKPKLAICTYHLIDDKVILQEKISNICSEYRFIQTRKILFAYC